MDSTLPHLKDSGERLLDLYWTFNGPCFPLGSSADFVNGQRILSLKLSVLACSPRLKSVPIP
jgi:hypothetical protein